MLTSWIVRAGDRILASPSSGQPRMPKQTPGDQRPEQIYLLVQPGGCAALARRLSAAAGRDACRKGQDTRAMAKPEAFAAIRPAFPHTPIAFLSSNVFVLHRQRFSHDFIDEALNTSILGAVR